MGKMGHVLRFLQLGVVLLLCMPGSQAEFNSDAAEGLANVLTQLVAAIQLSVSEGTWVDSSGLSDGDLDGVPEAVLEALESGGFASLAELRMVREELELEDAVLLLHMSTDMLVVAGAGTGDAELLVALDTLATALEDYDAADSATVSGAAVAAHNFALEADIYDSSRYAKHATLQATLIAVDRAIQRGGGAASLLCPPGSYVPSGTNVCAACPAGYTCGGKEEQPESCPAGYECPAGSRAPSYSCGAGFYSVGGAGRCTAVRAGYVRNSEGSAQQSCAAGYFCEGGASGAQACAAGHYCEAGASAETGCPTGSYAPAPGKLSACLDCLSGHQCNSTHSIQCLEGHYCTHNSTAACPAGQTSAAGAEQCSECAAGSYCTGGAAAVACSGGRPSYVLADGATSQLECTVGGGAAEPFYRDCLHAEYTSGPCSHLSHLADCVAAESTMNVTGADMPTGMALFANAVKVRIVECALQSHSTGILDMMVKEWEQSDEKDADLGAVNWAEKFAELLFAYGGDSPACSVSCLGSIAQDDACCSTGCDWQNRAAGVCTAEYTE